MPWLKPFEQGDEEASEKEERSHHVKSKLEEENEENESRKVKVMKAPGEPSQAEIDEHNASGHCPYRSWCKWCVAGHAVSKGHYRAKEEEDKVPTVSVDYMYMKERPQDEGQEDEGDEDDESVTKRGMGRSRLTGKTSWKFSFLFQILF